MYSYKSCNEIVIEKEKRYRITNTIIRVSEIIIIKIKEFKFIIRDEEKCLFSYYRALCEYEYELNSTSIKK